MSATHPQNGAVQLALPVRNPFGYSDDPANCFSHASLMRGSKLLSEGYEIGRMYPQVAPISVTRDGERRVVAMFSVDRPWERVNKDGIPWYLVRFFDDGSADCDCARGLLGGDKCCHIAACLHYGRISENFWTARMVEGREVLSVSESTRMKTVVLGDDCPLCFRRGHGYAECDACMKSMGGRI